MERPPSAACHLGAGKAVTSTSSPVMTFSKIGPSSTYLGAMRVIGPMKLVRNPSLSSILLRSVGKPSVMFLRLPPKKLTSTRLPLIVPGTSPNTKQGAPSSWTMPATMPISCCQLRPLTSLTSPSFIDPAFAHAFVGQSVNMLEQKKPDHKLCRNSRPATIAVQRRDLAVDELPVDLARELH